MRAAARSPVAASASPALCSWARRLASSDKCDASVCIRSRAVASRASSNVAWRRAASATSGVLAASRAASRAFSAHFLGQAVVVALEVHGRQPLAGGAAALRHAGRRARAALQMRSRARWR